MGDPTLMDRTYLFILSYMKEKGSAPHYTDIAREMGLTVEEGRETLRELIGLGIPGTWLAPDTDYIGSFAPFSNLPTQYRISVDGKQKWFGQ